MMEPHDLCFCDRCGAAGANLPPGRHGVGKCEPNPGLVRILRVANATRKHGAVEVIDALLGVLGVRWSLRQTEVDPNHWRVDVSTDRPLAGDVKELIRRVVEDRRLPEARVEVSFARKKA